MNGTGSSGPDLPVERVLHELSRHEQERSSASAADDGFPPLPRYECRGRLGEGATAIVYRAWDWELQRPVAIKVLRDGATLSETALLRFRREAQVVANLSHPNVVTMYDAGESAGRLYLVMELVEGQPLSELLRSGRCAERQALEIVEKVARGIAAAHAKGVVHRDLKPANILVNAAGEPKVGDFGLAHLLDATTDLTRTGTALGTPSYMSPEQVRGRLKEQSPRTDVYGLGAILYEALLGRPPHTGESLAEIYDKVIHQEPDSPRKLKPGLPRDLETILGKALDKESGRRYASAEALAEDLRKHLAGEPIEARPDSPAVRAWRKAVKHRAILLPTLAAVALGLTLAAGSALRSLRTSARIGSALGEAVRAEREGRAEQARDLYRSVLELDASHARARSGLGRTEELLKGRKDHEAEALRQLAAPLLEEARGRVFVVVDGRRGPADAGREVAFGHGVETEGPGSSAVLRYPDQTRIRVEEDSAVEQCSGGAEPTSVRLCRGALRVSGTRSRPDAPVRLATPHGGIEAAAAEFSVASTAEATRVEVLQGKVRVLVAGVGRPVDLAPLQRAEARTGSPPSLTPLAGAALVRCRLGRRHFMLGLAHWAGAEAWVEETRGEGCAWDLRAYSVASGAARNAVSREAAMRGVRDTLSESARTGVLPVFTWNYLGQSLGEKSATLKREEVAKNNLENAEVMRDYFEYLKEFLRAAAAAGTPVILNCESNVWDDFQTDAVFRSHDPESILVRVASSGAPGLAAFPDTAAGFTKAVAALRDLYAPNVLLAWQSNHLMYGVVDPKRMAQFFGKCGAWDLLLLQCAYADAGLVAARSNNPEVPWTSKALDRILGSSRTLGQRLGVPLVLWNLPVGNRVMSACDNSAGHYMDDAVEYFLEGGPANRRAAEWAAAGYLGLVFGPFGQPDGTHPYDKRRDGVTNPPPAPLSRNEPSAVSDDDGGYLRRRAKEYYQSARVRLDD
jgi:tRNA A-37 threonylcarbamoyl transferase component Bud32